MILLLLQQYVWPVGEVVNTSPSQGDIHGSEPHTGHQMITNPYFIRVLLSYLI